MDYNGLQWNIMDYNGLQWNIMDYNGLQWIIMDCIGGSMGVPWIGRKITMFFSWRFPWIVIFPQDIGEIPERIINQHWLVVLTPLKNMKGNGKDYPIYDGK